MALADYQPERVVIEYKGKALISVRGLSFEDTTVLARNHLTDLQTIFTMFQGGGDSKLLLDQGDDVERLLFDVIVKAPGTVARAIALAADEPNGEADAARLPMPMQLKILIEIVRLTFEDVGGPLAFATMLSQIAGVPPPPPPDRPTIQ